MMQYSLLNQLCIDKHKENWKVKIRISRMWNAINSKNNDIISLDMILIDEQSNSIHAIIRNNIAKKFKPLLQEGKFYELSYFQVVDGNALYRPIDNDIKIMFTLKTSIKEIKEIDVDIPRHKFEFVDYNKIHERVNKHVQLSGEYNLSSTSGTRVYIDLDIPETTEFKDQLVENNQPIVQMPKQFKPQLTIEEEMNINRTTISEIKKIMWDSDNKETIFTCQGKIINIDIDHSGWYFISCEVCRRKVKSREEFFWCDNCNKKACFPITRYRIQLKVEDSSGMATFILFDSEAEKLLNISAKDLLNKSLEEPDEVILPVQIENLKGKQFVFQIQLNNYNFNYGWEIFTIKKLFDSFEETDIAIQLDKMTEVYISDTSNECSNNLSIEEDGDCTKFQKFDVQTNVQLTPTSVLKENKRAYSGTTTKQQKKKIQKTL
ncbi:hypothetical protein RGQ29_017377 [Quercus rubra]|uniref:Replication factor A C-terminal domain-containing protein n=1 Tax=Quercus rubra TaxID=3512 RepID=A0AAN7IXM5_QUERU|nr:hypothetical protein RGQ29_017377 [Quercus rubra]